MPDSIETPPSELHATRATNARKIIGVCVVTVAVVGGFVAARVLKKPDVVPHAAVTEALQPPAAPEPTAMVAPKPAPVTATTAKPTSTAAPIIPTATEPGAATSRDLVAGMWEICGIQGPVTQEQAERFKHHLEELIRGGAASVGASREVVDKDVELDFV